MHRFRTLMLTLIWFSLLTVPYMLITYACYAGICGGEGVAEFRNHPYYVSIMGYSTWIYPLIVFCSLFLSRKLSNRPYYSIFILFLPLVCLIPFGYVNYQANNIDTTHTQQETDFYSPQPDDFVCSSGKFIRYFALPPPGRFAFFNITYPTHTVNFFRTREELKEFLEKTHIDTSQCKNKKGISLY